jgi:glycine/D-amino acid oxidase-like deaminating enzyme
MQSDQKATTFAPTTGTGSNYDRRRFALGRRSSVLVVGAGAFGGWTALHLLRSGYKVTLVDAWGAGNSRSSSGDETRVIRSTYGANEFYFDLNVRALELWKENEARFGKKLFFNAGVLWLCYRELEPLVDGSIPFAIRHGQPYELLDRAALRNRFPHLYTDDLHHGYLDPYGGYLKAREACQAVTDAFVREGGRLIQGRIIPFAISAGRLSAVKLEDGSQIQSDAFVFACGPWLPTLFPEVVGNRIKCTRQEAYYFGVDSRFAGAFDRMPCWVDVDGADYYYGIPGNAHRGFKIGVDRRGSEFDPTNGERLANPEVLSHARAFLGHRFPALRNAPLIESRVCPYESTADGNFILDQHPEAENLWLLGGGSGHGFKHGPALGELVSKVLQGERDVPGFMRLAAC